MNRTGAKAEYLLLPLFLQVYKGAVKKCHILLLVGAYDDQLATGLFFDVLNYGSFCVLIKTGKGLVH